MSTHTCVMAKNTKVNGCTTIATFLTGPTNAPKRMQKCCHNCSKKLCEQGQRQGVRVTFSRIDLVELFTEVGKRAVRVSVSRTEGGPALDPKDLVVGLELRLPVPPSTNKKKGAPEQAPIYLEPHCSNPAHAQTKAMFTDGKTDAITIRGEAYPICRSCSIAAGVAMDRDPDDKLGVIAPRSFEQAKRDAQSWKVAETRREKEAAERAQTQEEQDAFSYFLAPDGESEAKPAAKGPAILKIARSLADAKRGDQTHEDTTKKSATA